MILNTPHKEIYDLLSKVTDPEIPVLTIEDLGVLRSIDVTDDEVEVTITPTYVGCPAMDMITMNIKAILHEAGYPQINVKLVLDPPWTTDWMTEEGKKKLKEYGIAPPVGQASRIEALMDEVEVSCPRCDSTNTEVMSEFGSTACKALYRCLDCKEPFDYFKCH